MKILLAPDSFKDSLPANIVAKNLKVGLEHEIAENDILEFPISDGGEGFCSYLAQSCNGIFKTLKTVDALMRPVTIYYGLVGKIAIIDVATIIGLETLEKSERNPMKTSSFGLGIAIRYLIKQDVDKIIIGLGGSSTCDCGIGMVAALGYSFTDERGEEIEHNGGGIKNLVKIKIRKINEESIPIVAAFDVNNVLLGKNGAVRTYAKQKGASEKDLEILEYNFTLLHKLSKEYFQVDNSSIEGSGAAGGLGYGLKTFLNAKLVSGAKLFLSMSEFSKKIKDCNYLITGEGKIDNQTSYGKAPLEAAKIAKMNDVKSIAITAKLENSKVNIFDEIYTFKEFLNANENSFTDAEKIMVRIGKEIGRKIKEDVLYEA